MRSGDSSSSSSGATSARSAPPRSSRLSLTYPRATYSSATWLLPAPGMPITTTTSAPARSGGRSTSGRPKARVSAAAASASRSSAAARAAERAVSGRRAPGIGTTTGERPSSHASATSAGVALLASATRASSSTRPTRPARTGTAEGRVRHHCDPFLRAPVDDAPAQRAVVERAERDLDRRDRRQLERLVELPAVDVRETDAADETVVDEPRERAHRRAPRRARIRRVQEVEVDRQPVECGETRLAVGADRLRSAVGNPGAAGARHPALRHDPRALVRATRTQRSSEQGLVVAVRARRVEDGDAGIQPRRRSSRARLPRREARPSTDACSRDRCAAPSRRASEERPDRQPTRGVDVPRTRGFTTVYAPPTDRKPASTIGGVA